MAGITQNKQMPYFTKFEIIKQKRFSKSFKDSKRACKQE